MSAMKMYLLIHETVPLGYAMLAAAHASLAGYLRFIDHPDMKEWVSGRFDKVVCRADDLAFRRAKDLEGSLVLTESGLDDREVAVVLRPRQDWPKWVRFLPLYKGPRSAPPAVPNPA